MAQTAKLKLKGAVQRFVDGIWTSESSEQDFSTIIVVENSAANTVKVVTSSESFVVPVQGSTSFSNEHNYQYFYINDQQYRLYLSSETDAQQMHAMMQKFSGESRVSNQYHAFEALPAPSKRAISPANKRPASSYGFYQNNQIMNQGNSGPGKASPNQAHPSVGSLEARSSSTPHPGAFNQSKANPRSVSPNKQAPSNYDPSKPPPLPARRHSVVYSPSTSQVSFSSSHSIEQKVVYTPPQIVHASHSISQVFVQNPAPSIQIIHPVHPVPQQHYHPEPAHHSPMMSPHPPAHIHNPYQHQQQVFNQQPPQPFLQHHHYASPPPVVNQPYPVNYHDPSNQAIANNQYRQEYSQQYQQPQQYQYPQDQQYPQQHQYPYPQEQQHQKQQQQQQQHQKQHPPQQPQRPYQQQQQQKQQQQQQQQLNKSAETKSSALQSVESHISKLTADVDKLSVTSLQDLQLKNFEILDNELVNCLLTLDSMTEQDVPKTERKENIHKVMSLLDNLDKHKEQFISASQLKHSNQIQDSSRGALCSSGSVQAEPARQQLRRSSSPFQLPRSSENLQDSSRITIRSPDRLSTELQPQPPASQNQSSPSIDSPKKAYVSAKKSFISAKKPSPPPDSSIKGSSSPSVVSPLNRSPSLTEANKSNANPLASSLKSSGFAVKAPVRAPSSGTLPSNNPNHPNNIRQSEEEFPTADDSGTVEVSPIQESTRSSSVATGGAAKAPKQLPPAKVGAISPSLLKKFEQLPPQSPAGVPKAGVKKQASQYPKVMVPKTPFMPAPPKVPPRQINTMFQWEDEISTDDSTRMNVAAMHTNNPNFFSARR